MRVRSPPWVFKNENNSISKNNNWLASWFNVVYTTKKGD